ncbi:MAG: response regulator [Deltaproteobacteria bacterium]|nr:response regulator [Deltaproteobacteria bacterium]MBW2129120.1 response regulator [Deltaproteobacteria bacterium]
MNEKVSLNGKRILIVDDEPDILDTLEELLSDCDVSRAATFEEAREALETRYFDMVILDIMGVDGYRLLDIAAKKKITAVMLTAHALSPEDTAKSYKKGASYYVPKDRLADIRTYLQDIIEAREKGESPWSRWLNRFSSFYERKFGPDWLNRDKEFWDQFVERYRMW